MPTKEVMPLFEYIEKISYFRSEFLKRNDEFIKYKEKILEDFPFFSEEMAENFALPKFRKFVPNEKGEIIDEDKTLIAETDTPKSIDFTFRVNPYVDIEGFRDEFNKFKLECEKIFKDHMKNGYTKFQADYKYKNMKIDYFRIPGRDEPFSLWIRCLKSFEIQKKNVSNLKIGKELISLYGNMDDRSFRRAVTRDLKEAQRLIRCAKYDSFPNEPIPKEKRSEVIVPIKLRPPRFAIEAFQKKLSEPATQDAISKLQPRKKPKA